MTIPTRLALAASLLLAVGSAAAEDAVIDVPSPWIVQEPIDHEQGLTAAPVTTPAGDHGVLLHHAGASRVIPMPDRVFSVQVAPDGDHVRACSIVPTGYDGCGRKSRCKTMDATGAVLDDRTWRSGATFSADSARLVAWDGEAAADAAEISIHDRSGARLGGVKPRRRLYGAAGLGAPGCLVFAGRREVECVDPTPGSVVTWRHVLASDEYGINALGLVGSRLIRVAQSYGWWKLLDHSGEVRWTWDPQALSRADAERSWEDYAQYRPYGTPNPDWVVISDGSNEAFLLHVPTAQLTPASLDVAAPPGFVRQAGITGGHVVLHSSRSIRLRPVSLP